MNVAIIPARGKSQRIRNKNIINFLGKPIIYWPIVVAKKSKLFTNVYVSTDSSIIANISKKFGAEIPFIRPQNISDNKTGIIKVIKHAILNLEKKKIKFKYICCLFATAPFINKKILTKAYNKLKKGNYDFVFAAKKIDYSNLRSFFFNKKKLRMFNKKFYNYPSQKLPTAYVDAGQFYWGTKIAWKKKTSIFSENSSFIELGSDRFLDINTHNDLKKLKSLSVSRSILTNY